MPRKTQSASRLLGGLLLLASVALACTDDSDKAFNRHVLPGKGTSSQNTILNEIVTGVNDDGSITEVKGYSENSQIKSGEFWTAQELIKAKGERVFDFSPPEGYQAEFSPPMPISGSYLKAAFEFKECIDQTYQPKEPTGDDILKFMKTSALCGRLAVNVCVKLRAAGNKSDVFFRTPALKLDFHCAQESFTNLKFSTPAGADAQAGGVTPLTIAAGPAVVSVYVTNSPGCGEGGAWQPLTTDFKDWAVGPSGGRGGVYAKFRDFLGNESDCIKAAELPASSSNTAVLTINSGDRLTASQQVVLSVGQVENGAQASFMYITHTPGCSAGGVWEPFAATKAWTLLEANATANVFVALKDDKGRVSNCAAASIVHDNLPPTAASLRINGGDARTSASVVSLTLAATDAFDMLITNSAGCTSGTWEAFASSKSAWPLGQSNGVASVYAQFRDAVGNTGECLRASIVHDDQASETASLTINSGATYTNSGLVNLTLTGSGISSMYITNSASCSSGGLWEAYAASKAWTLSQANGTATVYAKFKDASGNESACVSDAIIHDDQAPSSSSLVIAGGLSHTNQTAISLGLAVSDATQMYLTNTLGCGSGGSWETYAATKVWNLGQTNALATVYVKFRDAANNESACISDTITHDSISPSATSLTIDSNATYATSTGVVLTLAATDAAEMYVTDTPACSGGGSWEAYSPSKAWVLGQTNATVSIYAKFRDTAGNESTCLSDAIIHDSLAPTSPSLQINAGAAAVATTSTSLTLAATDASEMYVTDTTGCASGGSWEPYATSKAWTLAQTNTTVAVSVKFRDLALNESSCVDDTIIHDSVGPTATSIAINSGASYTSSTSASLTLAATDAASMYITDVAACGSGGTWENYASSAPWTLAQTNATATVYVKFRDSLGNESNCESDTIVHDSVAPTAPSLSIAAGAASINTSVVGLSLAATDASNMYVTNTAGCASGGTWEAFQISKASWSLAQSNANATVYVKYKDEAGNETSCVSDTILHDAQAPASASLVIASGATYSTSSAVDLTLAATDASGISMYVTNTSGCGSGGSWESYATSKTGWSLGQTNATATVYVKFKDELDNETSCLSDSIIHDSQAPTAHSISIEAGAAATASSSVSLTLAATGASDMYLTNTAGCASGGAWESLATTKAGWSLAQSNGTATVYVKYKDSAGNETTCVSDTILHDGQAPTSASISVASGAAYTASTTVTLTLAATDASAMSMYITNTAGCGSDGIWEGYSASKSGWTLGQTNTTATVYVKFKDDLGNEGSCVSDAIIHDNQVPTIAIESAAAATSSSSVGLTLSAVGASDMYITNTAGCASGGSWETYATSKAAWALAQTNAVATVYAKFRDASNNESVCVSDAILHDSQAPTSASISIASGAAYTASASVALTLAATDASSLSMYVTNTVGCASGGTWENYATNKAGWTLSQTNATATVYVKFRDELSNESACLSDTIVHDDTAPSSPSLSIAAGAASVSSSSPSLTLAATGASEMYITNTAGCGGDGTWESFATSKAAWSLGQTNATTSVYAKFKDEAGNQTACVSDAILHDAQAPVSASISLASAAVYTTTASVALTLAATDASAMTMYITNTSGCASGGAWEAYATSKAAWTLGQTNAIATVYVKFKDDLGNETACLSDTIIHDDTAPSSHSLSLAAGAASTSSASVSLTLAASGASDMYISNTAGCGSGGSWETYATSKTGWGLAQTNATATVYVKYRDSAGNQSSCVSDAILHDAQAPTGASVSIAGAATYTTVTSVTLSLAASDASSLSMYITNIAGCASGGTWESYATNKAAWTLGQTNATATVYTKFKDDLGNETSCLSDTIIHDDTPPTSHSLAIAAGAAATSSTSVSLTLAASGASDMYITNTSGCGSGGSWEAFASTKAGWSLGQTNATATVYVTYKDSAGNQSSCVSDTILHDSQAPTSASISIAGAAAYTATASVALTLAATDASGMTMYITNTAGCGSGGAWENYATSKPSWSLSQSNATATVYAKFKDDLGFETSCLSDTIIHDDLPPTATSVSISAGAAYIGSSSTTLNLAATDGNEMYITNTSGCGSGGSWETYASTKSWTLAQSSGTATVYAKFRDAAGNASSCINDAVTIDATAPSAPASMNDGAWARGSTTSPALSWGTSTDTGGSGLAGYQLAIGTTSGGTNIIDWADIGNVTTASVASLNLTYGSTYYASVRAVDNAGNVSSATAGDGFIYAWHQEAYIKSNRGAEGESFGSSISLSNNTVAVGAYGNYGSGTVITNATAAPTTTDGGTDSGAVYIFKRSALTWAQEAYIKASNAAASDKFGSTLGIDGDTAVASAPGEDSNQVTITNGSTASTDNSKSASGALYVYTRAAAAWSQQAYIKTVNADSNDKIGDAVAISGDTLAATSVYEKSGWSTITNGTTATTNNNLTDPGAVYVYKRTGTTWEQEAYVKPANVAASLKFGTSVSLRGDTMVVGAIGDDSSQASITNGATASTNTAATDSGAAYVYVRAGTVWSQQAYLKPTNARANMGFGHSITVDGDTVAVGAPLEDSNQSTITNGTASSTDNSHTDIGAAYVFKRTGTAWAQEAYLKSTRASLSAASSWDGFGISISLSGENLAVGAHYDNSNVTSITNGTAASTNTAVAEMGAVYTYKRTGSTWVQEAYIKPANGLTLFYFGSDISLSDDTLAVGMEADPSNQTTITNGTGVSTNTSMPWTGAVFIYRK